MGAAAEGRFAESLLFLAASLALVVAARLVLIRLTRSALGGEDRSNELIHTADEPFDHFARRAPASRTGAVAAASLRQVVRDPVKVSQSIVGSLLFAGMFTAIAVAMLVQVAPQYAPLGAVGLCFGPLSRRLNEIGESGSAYWMEVLAPGPARAGLVGRDLAALALDVPLFVVVTVAIGIGARDLTLVPAALAFLAGATAVTYTISRASAVFLPTCVAAVSDEKAQERTQPSRTAALPAIIAIFVLVGIPSGVLIWQVVVDGSALAVAVACATMVLYGAVIYVAGLRLLGRWLDRNQPKLLARVEG
jgi:ABC-2 type transport system permease protein